MRELLAWGLVLLFLGCIGVGGRYHYRLVLQVEARRLRQAHGLELAELPCPFESIVYFVSMPSQVPEIRHAAKESLVIKPDYRSFLYPSLKGIEIFIKTDNEPILLAYLAMKEFRLTSLDQMLERGAISEASYQRLAACKLIAPSTIDEISEEVSRQIQSGRKGRKLAPQS